MLESASPCGGRAFVARVYLASDSAIGKDVSDIASQESDSDMIGIALVDDHPIALRGIEHLLAEVEDIKVLAAASSVAELRRKLAEAPQAPGPDVILMDLYHDGDEPCLEAIAELAPTVRVLVISASGRPEDVTGADRKSVV